MATHEKRQLTEAERAALDARDRSLITRFAAGDETVNRELVQRLDLMGKRAARRDWPRLYQMWHEFRGEYFDLLGRWRDEGKLRLDMSLYFLARRLLRQAGKKAGVVAHRDQIAMSFQGKGRHTRAARKRVAADEDRSHAAWLEKQARTAIAAQPRFPNAEAALGAREQLAWLVKKATEKLSSSERATFEAWVAVVEGEHESLAEALDVAVGTAYNRLSAMWASLRRIAVEEGATEILERLEGRRPRQRTQSSRPVTVNQPTPS